MAQSGRSDDRVTMSGSGRKADMPNQRVECPLMTLPGLARCKRRGWVPADPILCGIAKSLTE